MATPSIRAGRPAEAAPVASTQVGLRLLAELDAAYGPAPDPDPS